MITDGMFGITLHNLFVADVATFTAQGEDPVEGRPAVKYDFRLPRTQLGLEISLAERSGIVGEEGSFWADPTTLDLIRLTARVTEIPANLPLTSAEYSVSYARNARWRIRGPVNSTGRFGHAACQRGGRLRPLRLHLLPRVRIA
jgi:hypothetical protein